jgi:hypothetical protein
VAWSQNARDSAAASVFLVALAAGLFGLFRYLRSERLRQTEQVRELYRMFFVPRVWISTSCTHLSPRRKTEVTRPLLAALQPFRK